MYGKRFIQFDTLSVDEEGGESALATKNVVKTKKGGKKEIFPLWSEVNNYYLEVVVVNK